MFRGFIVNMGALMSTVAVGVSDLFDRLLLEDGSDLLLEDGGLILLESDDG